MTGKYPKLRSQVRRRKSGRVITYYFYDRRAEGEASIPLGKDFDAAVKRWNEIRNLAPRIVGTMEEAFMAWEEGPLLAYTSAETRRGYIKNLRQIRPVFGPATWDQVDLFTLKQYLEKRTAKTQANREMSLLSIVWNWARTQGMTTLPWPAAGMERSRWKNKEGVRKIKVQDLVWDAIRHEGDQALQDCMDLGSATGMRLTDCIGVLLPRDDTLHLDASKTGKEAEWDMSLSATLPDLVKRRRALVTNHLMLLSMPDGQPVTLSRLRSRWDKARERASVKASIANDTALVDAIRAQWLRDARKRAAQKSENLEAASELLQHSDKRLTEKHYGGVRKLRPVA